MNGNWKESEDGVVNLPEADPDIFSLYVEVLYSGRLQGVCNTKIYDYSTFARLYVLAEKLMDINMKNKALEFILLQSRVIGCESDVPGSSAIEIIYQGTTGDCPARKMMVDFYVGRARPDMENVWSSMPAFANDLIRGFIERKDELDLCDYCRGHFVNTCDLDYYHEE